jgi:L-lactate permease
VKTACIVVVAVLLVIFTEYFVLPFERRNNIVDGVGMPVMMLGWIILYRVFDDGAIEPCAPRNFYIGLSEL